MDKVIVTQAAMDAAADFLEAWEPGPEMTVVKLARAFDAFAAQQQVEPVPVAWQRRQKYSDIPGYVPQWQVVSKNEATSHFERRAGYEYRPLYAAPEKDV